MENTWLEHLKVNLPNFLETVRKDSFNFSPVSYGLTSEGSKLNLGMSCYALKIYYMTGLWEELSSDEQISWGNYINSFQNNSHKFPKNSFIDQNYLNAYENPSFTKNFKNITKKFLNFFKSNQYILNEEKLNNFIRAESKQAIASLYQVGFKNNKPYKLPFNNPSDLIGYLEALDWNKPWDAGAQFSSMCVIVETQLDSKEEKLLYKEYLNKFIASMCDNQTGTYYKKEKPSEKELINGAMKVITGLDWIGSSILFPEKLINTCLNIEPYEEGCDLVDLVYVLYMCSKNSNYKKEEIKKYFEKILLKIEKHYFYNEGGFSYFSKKSQTSYYGIKISEGKEVPDLHGTILLVWAISMISQVIDLPTSNWKVLKP